MSDLDTKLELFRSPIIYKTALEIQAQWIAYRNKTLGENKMLTRDGVCFALKIFRSEWETFKQHEKLGLAIEWIEQQIGDDWVQELVKTGHAAGALAYLKAHYPDRYGETAAISIGNMSLSFLLVQAHENLKLKNANEQ